MNHPWEHLDRALTGIPLELSDAVEDAFKRGEKAVKQRRKVLVALAVAAGIAVVSAAISFAGSRIGVSRPDRVAVTLPDDREVYDDLTRRSAPPETAAPEPEETTRSEQSGRKVYYATINGKYFHADEHCSGMMTALPIMADAALILGKLACPVCCPAGIQMQFCWATEQGTYYHHDRNCMAMLNAIYCTVTVAEARGQLPCPECWGK